jgi:hypothetical protein
MKPDAQTKASEVKKERKNKYGRHGWNTSIKIYFLGDAEIMHWENRLIMIYNAGEAEIMHQAMYIGRHITAHKHCTVLYCIRVQRTLAYLL